MTNRLKDTEVKHLTGRSSNLEPEDVILKVAFQTLSDWPFSVDISSSGTTFCKKLALVQLDIDTCIIRGQLIIVSKEVGSMLPVSQHVRTYCLPYRQFYYSDHTWAIASLRAELSASFFNVSFAFCSLRPMEVKSVNASAIFHPEISPHPPARHAAEYFSQRAGALPLITEEVCSKNMNQSYGGFENH